MGILLSSFFICYLVISMIFRKPVFLLAFLLCEIAVYTPLLSAEFHIYLLEFVLYSYVYSQCPTRKSASACGILLIISVISTVESAFYGAGGAHGEIKTAYHDIIEYIYIGAHCFFVYSFICYSKLRNSLRDFINSFNRLSCYFNFTTVVC